MKKKIALLILIFIGIILNAIIIPYSQTKLKTETNHLFEFVRISPDDSLAIPLQTDVWLWYDKDNLYVHWEAEVDENFEKGKLANTDVWIECDKMRIQIITDVKNYNTYYFYAVPFGNKSDGIRKSDMNLDSDWNSQYEYENFVSDKLWISTMKIPFKDLRFYGNPPFNWKIILTRYFEKSDEYYSIPYGKIEMGKDYFRSAYDISINEELSKNKNYRVAPYFIKKYDLMEKTDSFDPEHIGLDFSYNPTSSTKVKISLNPDFSDIPMDSAEDNFNIRYAPYYQENRYFFIEDLDVFGVSNNLFYSRHIMQPQYAVKLTGNSENFSYGFLSAFDKEVSEDGEILNSDDIYNMLAFKPKWKDLSIQMTLLNRMNKDYHNEVLVVNPNWEFMKNQSVWGQLDFTLKDGYGSDNEEGYAMYFGYSGKRGDVDWDVSGSRMSRDYIADMGRVYQTDYTSAYANICLEREPNGKIIKKYGSNLWVNRSVMNEDYVLDCQNAGGSFWVNSPKKYNFSINMNIGEENYEDTTYSWDNIYLNIGNWSLSWLSAHLNYSTGRTLVYNLSKISGRDCISFSLNGDLGNNVSYSTSAQRHRYFDFPAECEMDDEYWIGNADFTINFSNKLSITNGLRYNNYEDESLTTYLGVFSNLRFEFKDDCNLYLGYKTAQEEIEQEFNTDFKQAYMKVVYTF
jgi:Domain of unknown function (DUF5916)